MLFCLKNPSWLIPSKTLRHEMKLHSTDSSQSPDHFLPKIAWAVFSAKNMTKFLFGSTYTFSIDLFTYWTVKLCQKNTLHIWNWVVLWPNTYESYFMATSNIKFRLSNQMELSFSIREKRSGASLISQSLMGSFLTQQSFSSFDLSPLMIPQATARYDLPQISSLF